MSTVINIVLYAKVLTSGLQSLATLKMGLVPKYDSRVGAFSLSFEAMRREEMKVELAGNGH